MTRLFRTLAILSLTFAALLIGLPGAWSYFEPVCFRVPVSERRLGYVYFADGLVRFYGYQADDDIYLRSMDGFRSVAFFRRSDDAPVLRIHHAQPWQIPSHAVVVTRFASVRTTPPTAVSLYGLRTSVSLVIVVCMAYPVVALVADMFRRRRRLRAGFCRVCEYDLTGNESGYCSECGAGIVRNGLCRGCGAGPINRSNPECPACGLPIATHA